MPEGIILVFNIKKRYLSFGLCDGKKSWPVYKRIFTTKITLTGGLFTQTGLSPVLNAGGVVIGVEVFEEYLFGFVLRGTDDTQLYKYWQNQ